MTVTTTKKSSTFTQKLIKIGDSKGTTIPAKELKRLRINMGDNLEITIRKVSDDASDAEVMQAAKSILERYKQDFSNLAQR